ncbi:MAG: hypothetical protein IKT33_00780, partial [Clostridia bacterium]|nr:hypothetical protein [Clostridia bacterium]
MNFIKNFKEKKFDFVRYGRFFFIAPAVILVLGIIMLATFGLNLGLDFTGGTIVKINADGEYTKAEIQDKMNSFDVKYSIAQEQNTNGGNSFSIKFNAEDNTNEIVTELETFFESDFMEYTTSTDTTIKETIMSVFWSILAALAGLIIYMLIRFKFTAGMSTILALMHDVLMIVSLMTIFQIQINASFIAAILTVMAYSINNSLVVFDRVRTLEKNNTENQKLSDLVNQSINHTLGRSILTAATTLGTLLVLTIISLVMNLSTLIEFALPIIFGLFAG